MRHTRSLRQLQPAHWISLDEADDRSSQFYQMFEVNDIHTPQRVTECTVVLLALNPVKSSDAFMPLSRVATAATSAQSIQDLVWVDVDERVPDSLFTGCARIDTR